MPRPEPPPMEVVRRILDQSAMRGGASRDVIEPSPHAGLFRRHAVFLVRAEGAFVFRHCILPSSSRSVGLCAYADGALTYLHAEEPGLDRVLALEGPSFFEQDASLLARLFLDLLVRGLPGASLIEDVDQDEELSAVLRSDSVDPSIRAAIEPAKCTREEDGDSTLTLTCLGLPYRGDLGRVVVRVSRAFDCRFETTTLMPEALVDDLSYF